MFLLNRHNGDVKTFVYTATAFCSNTDNNNFDATVLDIDNIFQRVELQL